LEVDVDDAEDLDGIEAFNHLLLTRQLDHRPLLDGLVGYDIVKEPRDYCRSDDKTRNDIQGSTVLGTL
jgi:hypothetical protein